MTQVLACLEGPATTPIVCDYAVWVSSRIKAPLAFLEASDQRCSALRAGANGRTRQNFLRRVAECLIPQYERRTCSTAARDPSVLTSASEQAAYGEAGGPQALPGDDDPLHSLMKLKEGIRLLVISHGDPISLQLESVVRKIRKPILLTPGVFSVPKSVMLAFDGSAATGRAIEMLATSLLFKGLPMHLVMVGEATGDARKLLDTAGDTLSAASFAVQTAIRSGDIGPALRAYQNEHGVDLLVMGAFGGFPLRRFLLGSTTRCLLRTAATPVLLLS
ncbi:Universal stress protein family protein [compost metagenome]